MPAAGGQGLASLSGRSTGVERGLGRCGTGKAPTKPTHPFRLRPSGRYPPGDVPHRRSALQSSEARTRTTSGCTKTWPILGLQTRRLRKKCSRRGCPRAGKSGATTALSPSWASEVAGWAPGMPYLLKPVPTSPNSSASDPSASNPGFPPSFGVRRAGRDDRHGHQPVELPQPGRGVSFWGPIPRGRESPSTCAARQAPLGGLPLEGQPYRTAAARALSGLDPTRHCRLTFCTVYALIVSRQTVGIQEAADFLGAAARALRRRNLLPDEAHQPGDEGTASGGCSRSRSVPLSQPVAPAHARKSSHDPQISLVPVQARNGSDGTDMPEVGLEPTSLTAEDFLTPTAFAAVLREAGRSWSGARLHPSL
jgi:hypothetical protein